MAMLPNRRGTDSTPYTNATLLTLLVGLVAACGAHTKPTPSSPIEDVSLPRDSSTSTSSTWCVAESLISSESEFGVVGPLAELNTQFLQAHARARSRQCTDLEANRLVLRYAFGLFEARFRGKEITRTYIIPKEYHPVKDVSHSVYLAALLFAEPAGAERDRHVAHALSALNSALVELANPSSSTATLLPASFHDRQFRLLHRTLDAIASFSVARLDIAAQKAYFESVRADVNDNLRDIAIVSLQTLHLAVQSTRTKMAKVDPQAWDSALVVVGVMHQARAREIGIQYFERLLNERVGEGARNERRLVVAEHMVLPSEQLGLLSAHLVDEEGATAVFADPLRLQWDALGDVDPTTLDALFHQ